MHTAFSPSGIQFSLHHTHTCPDHPDVQKHLDIVLECLHFQMAYQYNKVERDHLGRHRADHGQECEGGEGGFILHTDVQGYTDFFVSSAR